MLKLFVLGILLVFFFILIVQVFKKNDRNYLHKTGINYILIATSVFVCFLGLELYLRYGYQETAGGPKLVLHKYKELNEKINRENKIIAQKNPHGFTDKVRREQKDPGVYRVAVLGDSFIWGDGVPSDQVWSHKLERQLVAAYPGQVEVLSWGRRGWSTLDEYNFLKKYGVDYAIDLIIIGFVTNDTDMGYYKQRYFKLNNVSIVKIFKIFFPNSIDLIGDQLEYLLSNYINIGYANWEQQLYYQKNLKRYGQLLNKLADYCKKNKIDLLFVNTPPNHNILYEKKFECIIPFLKTANIAYLDLNPAIVRDLGQYTRFQLMANPANAHPGPLVTEVYANEVLAYLQNNHLKHLGKN